MTFFNRTADDLQWPTLPKREMTYNDLPQQNGDRESVSIYRWETDDNIEGPAAEPGDVGEVNRVQIYVFLSEGEVGSGYLRPRCHSDNEISSGERVAMALWILTDRSGCRGSCMETAALLDWGWVNSLSSQSYRVSEDTRLSTPDL